MGDENEPTPSTSAAARKKEEKARKKDQRSWENVMKSMGDIPNSEKIGILKDKYTLLYNDLRRTVSNYQSLEKKYITLQRLRDQTQSELNKNILAKAKLESVCRELQKQNKAIKDENITRIKEEEEKRREVATNFTERLNSLCSMMDENKDKSVRLREENMNMTLRLTELYNKFQERESHLADVNRQLDAQKELFESKIKKMELEYKADRKAWEEESKNLLTNLLKSTETNRLLEENIKSMQANLDVYKNQYSDFEQTMSRSNEVFKTFHGEINKLQKSNSSLEKEKNEYVSKWQSCHNTVVEISEKNQQLVKKLELNEKKVTTLEKLCRQLQAERTTLHKQKQIDKVEPAAVSVQPQEPQVSVVESPKQEQTLSNEPPKKACNGVSKSADGNLGDGDEDTESDDPQSDDEPSSEKVDQAQNVDPDILYSELLDIPQDNDPSPMEYSDVEVEAAGDGTAELTVAQLAEEFDFNSDAGEEVENITITEVPDLSSSDISIKETRSDPITKKEHEEIEVEVQVHADREGHRGSSGDLAGGSSGNLVEELSLESLPLYKPHAVTDVPSQGGHAVLVKGSEARTDIRNPVVETQDVASQVPPEDTDSETINLKGSQGKTEIRKKFGKK